MPDRNLCLQYLKETGRSPANYWGQCDMLAIETRQWLERKGYQGFIRVLYIKPAVEISDTITMRETVKILNPENARVGADNVFDDEDGDPVVEWHFHAALSVDGKIHDIWKPEVVDEEIYFSTGFKQKIEIIPEEEWKG